jgi:hypothetical protein
MDELRGVINKHSRENESDTPDYLLAEYVIDCLVAYERTVTLRDKWHGRERPTAASYHVEAESGS